MRPVLPLLLLAPAMLLATACEMPSGHRPTEAEMLASESFDGLDREVVWAVIESEMRRLGYRIDAMESSAARGEFETYWQENLSPFRFEGTRTKLLGVLVEDPARPGRFRVLGATWVQRNADIKDPMNPELAIWQDEPRDASATRLFLYAVEQHFLGPDIRPSGGAR